MHHGPLRTTIPSSRINDDLILDPTHWNIIIQHENEFVGRNFKDELISDHTMQSRRGEEFSLKCFNHCFVYVVTETVGDYPYPYLTEKTWKAIVSKMPFMIIGGPNSLHQLQQFGFKTFSQWWSEDYDCLPTVAQRIESIVVELKKLSNLSIQDRVNLKHDMQHIVNHNHKHLASFISFDLDNIKKSL